MAKFSGLATKVRPTTEQSPRVVAGPKRIVLHHAATTNLDQVVAMMMPGGRQVSAHMAIKDKQIVAVVDENMRAWSLSSPVQDSLANTAECCNSQVGGAWPLSPATHESIAQVVADWCRRNRIVPNRSGAPKTWTVIGHREVYTIYGASYATACPGGMDLNWITRRAKQILGDTSVVVPPIVIGQGPSAPPATNNGFANTTIQARVNALGYQPPLEKDGIYGPATTKGVLWMQKFLNAHGAHLVLDGDYGAATDAAYLAYAKGKPTVPKPTPTPSGKLLVDGVFGPATVTRLQRELTEEGRKPGAIDGRWGPSTAKALQRKLGVKADGLFKTISIKALQKYLGVKQDGDWGRLTTSALQRRLNADTF